MTDRDHAMPDWEDIDAPDKSIDLVAVLGVFVRRWPFILAMGVGCGALAIGIAFGLTARFTSRAVFLPPTQHVSAADNPLSLLWRPPSTEIYGGLLLSDSVLDDVVAHTDLQQVLKARDAQDARERLRSIAQVSTDTSGFVTLQVTHKDPKLARDIAGNFLTALSRLNNRMASSQAAQQRSFYKGELEDEKNELETAEVNLKREQEASGVILPQSQTQAGLTAIDTARAQIRAQQIRLVALLQQETEQAPDVVTARSELSALEGQLHSLQSGSSGTAGAGLTAANAPSANLEYVRLEREVKYHQTLFDIMSKQYENAKLEESSAAPLVQVVDYPEIPIRKSWPPRTLFGIVGGVAGVILALATVFVRNRWEVLHNTAGKESPLRPLREAFEQATLRP